MHIKHFGFIPLNTHPLLIITIAYFCGIALQIIATPIISIAIYALSLMVAGGYSYSTHKLLPTMYLALAMSMLGSALYQRQIHNHNSFYTYINNAPYDICATVTSIEKIQHPTAQKCITVSIDQIKKEGQKDWLPYNGTLQIYTSHAGIIDVADVIEISNLRSKKPANESFERYLMKEGINASVFAHDLDYKLIKRPRVSFNRFLSDQRKRIISAFKHKLSRNTFALTTSVFLGYKATVKKTLDQLKEPFKVWGVSHYLARSGLHLVIFVAIWGFILNKLPLIFWIKDLFVAFLCLLYFLLSWQSISFIRALALFIGYKICTFTHVRPNFLHLLTLVSLAVVLYNPMQLFFLDFQLSFGLTFALAWLSNTQSQSAALSKS